MKGVILAGGTGSRLYPLTKVTNKHLLPVYDKPMIYYPLELLISCGIKEIMLITGPENAGDFAELLGDGSEFGLSIIYRVQQKALGIAHGIGLAEGFAHEGNIMVILGDNIFALPEKEKDRLRDEVMGFDSEKERGGMVFLKRVPDPQRFGVAEIDSEKGIIGIEEKPKDPRSDYAVTGLYLYDNTVFDKIRTLKPSGRGEYEVTDISNLYLKEGRLLYMILEGEWTDAGTFESLHHASEMARKRSSGG
jgi:glucose-1-phosphate thymidylyltransferase